MLRFRIFQIFRICTLRAGDPYHIDHMTCLWKACHLIHLNVADNRGLLTVLLWKQHNVLYSIREKMTTAKIYCWESLILFTKFIIPCSWYKTTLFLFCQKNCPRTIINLIKIIISACLTSKRDRPEAIKTCWWNFQ